jgi:hypothetical protein
MFLATLLITIALLGTSIFVAKKLEPNVRPVKVRVEKKKK